VACPLGSGDIAIWQRHVRFSPPRRIQGIKSCYRHGCYDAIISGRAAAAVTEPRRGHRWKSNSLPFSQYPQAKRGIFPGARDDSVIECDWSFVEVANGSWRISKGHSPAGKALLAMLRQLVLRPEFNKLFGGRRRQLCIVPLQILELILGRGPSQQSVLQEGAQCRPCETRCLA